uniref:Uncharacterized protein n=1 Tax=Anguilla anguilla TaxID=7936 RepID=A0A0E9UBQ7_ANGAN
MKLIRSAPSLDHLS